ncbi:MAG: S8 family serine peptidase, partial [Calditrichaeota bacterium]|nr:S8 family serine peptidase [Calditrichota bacterium]
DQDQEDNFHRFADGIVVNNFGTDPENSYNFGANTTLSASLVWDDYPQSDQDIDFELVWFNGDEWVTVAVSDGEQNGDDPPTEYISYVTENAGQHGLRVHAYSAENGRDFTIISKYNLGYKTPAGSMGVPAVAVGCFTVGAMYWQDWNVDEASVEPFSSRGPTYDDRIKPEITGPDAVSTFAYDEQPFFGTSAACPHVAGAAVLVLAEDLDRTNQDIWDNLIGNAVDHGDEGRDNLFGYGKVQLNLERREIHVPDDFETIQAAIDDARDGDRILVDADTYVENINFNGKNIELIGNPDDPSQVVIDADENGIAVMINSGESIVTTLTGFTIQNSRNNEQTQGGGIKIDENSAATITHCIIQNNRSENGSGGGVWVGNGSELTIEDCLIRGNYSLGSGGGISLRAVEAQITRCVITDNTCTLIGGGIESANSTSVIRNTTLYGNETTAAHGYEGGALGVDDGSNTTVINTIMWSNSPQEIWCSGNNSSSELSINNSDLNGGQDGIVTSNNLNITWGEGNIDSDPLFADPDNGDFHLTANSPCINTGDPDSPDDPDGTRADMGAIPYDHNPPSIAVSPGSIETNLDIPATEEHTLTVGNSGEMNLSFEIEKVFGSEPQRVGRDDNGRQLRGANNAGPQRDNPGDVLDTYEVPYAAWTGLAWDGDYMWGLGYNDNIMIACDPDNGDIIHEIEMRGNPLAMTFDGELLWTGGWSGDMISFWDLDGNYVDEAQMPFNQIAGMAFDHNGHVLMNSRTDGRIHVMSTEDLEQVAVFDFTEAMSDQIWAIEWVPDHFNGQFWGIDTENIYQAYVDEDWNVESVQSFGCDNDYQYALAHDGINLWYGMWNEANWYVVDDGISEVYWLSCEPTRGTVDPNGEMGITLTIDTDGLVGGTYEADVVFWSNDPEHEENGLAINVIVNTTGFVQIAAEWEPGFGDDPSIVNFNTQFDPELFSGFEYRIPVTISNPGSSVLEITGIASDEGGDPVFTATPVEFTISPYDEEIVDFIFQTPLNAPGEFNAEIIISNNDADEGDRELHIAVHAAADGPPVMSIDPGGIETNLDIPESGEYALTVSNTGDSRLDYNVEIVITNEPQRDENIRNLRSTGNLAAPRRDVNERVLRRASSARKGGSMGKAPSRDNASEPDDQGYEWRDNDEDYGPTYEWVDIREWDGVREWNFGDDDNTGALDLGFTFPFWDREFQQVYLDTDGWMSFTYGGDDWTTYQSVPNYPMEAGDNEQHGNTIVAYGTDHTEGTDIWYWTNNDDQAIAMWAGDYQYWFEVIFNDNGLAVMQYGQNSNNMDANVGVNLGDGEHGWFIHDVDRNYIAPGRAIGFGPAAAWIDWIAIDPAEGEIEPNGEDDALTVTLDTEGLVEGTYEANIVLWSNDPEYEANGLVVGVVLHTTGSAQIAAEWDPGFEDDPSIVNFNTAFDPDLYSGSEYRIPVTIFNDGSAVLEISGIASDEEGEPVFTADPVELTVSPYDEEIVEFIFHTPIDAPGEFNAEIIISNNDADEGDREFHIAVHANAEEPPVMLIEPDGIETNLDIPATEEHSLTLTNSGGSDLTYQIEKITLQEPARDENTRSLRSANGAIAPSRDEDAGEIIGQWNCQVPANSYKNGCYDPDHEYFWVSNYSNPSQIYIHDADNNYAEVRRWAPGINPMDLAYMNGVCYVMWIWNPTLYRFDVEGNNIGNLALQGHSGINGVACDRENELIMAVTGSGNPHTLNVFNTNGAMVATVGDINPYVDNILFRTIEWVPEHPDGELWVSCQNWAYEVDVDTDNWEFVGDGEVQRFATRNASEYGLLAHDGENMWISEHASSTIWCYTDGVTELNWLIFEPTDGTLEPDSSIDIDVTLNTEDLIEGTYEADLVFWTNDPEYQEEGLAINVLLSTSGQAHIEAVWGSGFDEDPSVVNFNTEFEPNFFTGFEYRIPVTIINVGTAVLRISDIVSDEDGEPVFRADPTELEIAPETEAEVDFIFEVAADAPGDYNAEMVISNNDADEEEREFHIAVHADVGEPPLMVIEPDSIETEVAIPGTEEHTLTLSNNGGSYLVYEIEKVILQMPGRDQSTRTLRSTNGATAPSRDDAGDLIAQFNGINGASQYSSCIGWDWDNERMWVSNYSADVIAAYTHDNNYENFEESIRINFGDAMDGCWVNGLLFIGTWSNATLNRFDANGQNIGSIQFPFAVYGIAADVEEQLFFVMQSGSQDIHVYEINDQNSFGDEIGSITNHLQYHANSNCYGLDWVPAHPDGPLWMTSGSGNNAYQISVDTDQWTCTGTVQSFGIGGNGQQYCSVAHDGENIWASGYTASNIRIYDDGVEESNWLMFDPEEGTVDPDGEQGIDVSLYTEGLVEGIYEADLIFWTNQPEYRDEGLAVNVLMTTVGQAHVDAEWIPGFENDPSVVDFNVEFDPDLYTGVNYTIPVTILNLGSAVLEISNIVSDEEGDPLFTANPTELQIEPNEEAVVDFTFEAPGDAPDDYNVDMIISCNDFDEEDQEYHISVHANAALPPILTLSTQEIIDELYTGETSVHEVAVGNDGQSTLRFTSEVEITSQPERDGNTRSLRGINTTRPHRDDVGDLLYTISHPLATSNYKSLAWDYDNNWMWMCEYSGSKRNIAFDLDGWNPNMDEQNDPPEIVAQWNNPGVNPMDCAYYNGVLYYMNIWNTYVGRYDRDGNSIGNLNVNLDGGQVNGVAIDSETGMMIVMSNQSPLHLFQFDLENNGQRIGRIGGNGIYPAQGNEWGRVLEFVPGHPDGPLWSGTSNRLYQMAMNMDDDLWVLGDRILDFARTASQQYDGVAHDGENLWSTNYSSQIIQVFDDGITEFMWITHEPTEGTIDAQADSVIIEVTLNATGLAEGEYTAVLTILTNDPATPEGVVDVTLNVVGAPDLVLEWEIGLSENGHADEASIIDWNAYFDPDIYTGHEYEIPVTVSNIGVATLEISDISSSEEGEPHFTSDLVDALQIEPNESGEITLIFYSDEATEFPLENEEIFMVFTSDDPLEEAISIPVHAFPLSPPTLVIEPDSIDAEVVIPESETHQLNVSNTGDTSLRFEIEKVIVQEPARDQSVRALRSTEHVIGPYRDDPGDVLARFTWNRNPTNYKSGIAWDAENKLMWLTSYTNRWCAAIDPNDDFSVVSEFQPNYNLMDACIVNGEIWAVPWSSTMVSRYNFNGQFLGNINLPDGRRPTAMDYSAEHNVFMTVSDNDWLLHFYNVNGAQLQTIGTSNFRNLVNNSYSRSMVWVDDHQDGQLWLNIGDPNRGVVQLHVNTDDWQADELVQRIQYENANDQWSGVGHDGTNLWFGVRTQQEYMVVDDGIIEAWLHFEPEAGELEPDANIDIDITLISEGTIEGTYEADLIFWTNDPRYSEEGFAVNIVMTTIGQAHIEAEWDPGFEEDPSVLNFNTEFDPDLYTVGSYSIPVTIMNVGDAVLRISDIVSDEDGDPVFTADPTELVITPDHEAVVDFIFDAPDDAPADYNAEMIISCNDFDEVDQEFHIAVHADAASPPIVSVDPQEIAENMTVGQVIYRDITVANDGRSTLRFTSEVEFTDGGQRDAAGRSLRSTKKLNSPHRDDLGDQIATYTWNRAPASNYKHAAYDHVNDWMWLSSYSSRYIGAVSFDEDYQQFSTRLDFMHPQNPMDMFTRNGILYTNHYTNTSFYRYDSEGSQIGGNVEITPRPDAMSYSPELELLFSFSNVAGGDAAAYEVSVFEFTNETTVNMIAHFPLRNQHGIPSNLNSRGMSWVDAHSRDGQLWIIDSAPNPNRIWQIMIDTDNWQVADANNRFASTSDEYWDGLAHDGRNLWAGSYNESVFRIYDDGIVENQWLFYEPTEGEIAADGEDVIIDVELNARGLEAGDYYAELTIITNDPATPEVLVDISISVSDAPDLILEWELGLSEDGHADETSIIDWNEYFAPDFFTGYSYDVVVTLRNEGTEVLNISEVSSSEEGEPRFTSDVEAEFQLAVDEETEVTLTFYSDDVGEYPPDNEELFMVFYSDDPNEQELAIPINADVIAPPNFTINVEAITDELINFDSNNHLISIGNDGGSTLIIEPDLEFIDGDGNRDNKSRSLRSIDGIVAPRRDTGNPGDLIASFSGNNVANDYSSCIGWDYDNERMWVSVYSAANAVAWSHDNNYENFEEELRIAPGNCMDGCWANGLLFLGSWSNSVINRYDANGQNIGSIQFPFSVYGIAADIEEQWFIVLSSDANIYIYEITEENTFGDRIGTISNHMAYHGNSNCYGLDWVPAHSDAPLWMTSGSNNVAYQIAVDRENWTCIDSDETVSFNIGGNGQQYCSVAHDGEYIWASGYTASDIRIYDDGVIEKYWLSLWEGNLDEQDNPDNWVRLDELYEIDANGEFLVTARLEAGELEHGEYRAIIHFLTNDPAEGKDHIEIPVTLTIADAQDIDVLWADNHGYPDELNWNSAYDEVLAGETYNVRIRIQNLCRDYTDLNVGNITADDEAFSVDETEFSVAAGEYQDVTVTFNVDADDVGEYVNTLTISSDDPDEGEFEISLYVHAYYYHNLVADPDAIDEELFTGQIMEIAVNLLNEGGDARNFEITHEIIAEPERDNSSRSLRSTGNAGRSSRDDAGDLIAQFAGPNAAYQYWSPVGWDPDNEVMFFNGYSSSQVAVWSHDDYENFQEVRRFAVSRPMDGGWYDGVIYCCNLTANSTLYRFDIEGNNIGNLAMGFATYGVAFDNEEGWMFARNQNAGGVIQVYEMNGNDRGQQIATLPNPSQYNGGNANLYNLEWVPSHPDGQLWQANNNQNLYQIAVNTDDWEYIEAVQNFNVGVSQPYDACAHDGENIWIGGYTNANIRIYDDGVAEVRWLAYEPKEGSLAGDAELDITVTLNATGLDEGLYEAILYITPDHPDILTLEIPVSMEMTASSDIEISWDEEVGYPDVVDWNSESAYSDQVFTGGSYNMTLTVNNNGVLPLDVTEISSNLGIFSLDPTTINGLEPDEEIQVTITLETEEPDEYEGSITFFSNSEIHPEVTVELHALVLAPPSMDVHPVEVTAELGYGDTEDHMVVIVNEGGAVLNWDSDVEIISEPDRAPDRDESYERSLRSTKRASGPRRDNLGDVIAQFSVANHAQGQYKSGIAY